MNAITTHGRSLLTGALLISASLILSGCASSNTSGTKPVANDGRTYTFWPQFPDDPRLQFIKGFSQNEDVTEKTSSTIDKLVFGDQPASNELINKPYGAAMHDGKIYVCDIRNACVEVLDLKKKQTRLIGTTGTMALKRPGSVAAAANGEIFVTDNDRNAIVVFDANERYSRSMGHPKLKPGGIAIGPDRIYVTDLAAQTVEMYDPKTGEKKGTFGTVGDEDGQFRLPLGVAVGPTGDVFVSDMMRCRIQRFTKDGKFISGFGTVGDYAGAFVRPKHIAVDSDGIIYVVDASFQNVQMFDDQARLLMHFGSTGDFPGSMNLPAGICVSDDAIDLFKDRIHPGFQPKRYVVVTNQFGSTKVSLYAMGALKNGFTAKDIAAATAKIPTGLGDGAKSILQNPIPGTEVAPPPGEPAPKPAAESPAAAPSPAAEPTPGQTPAPAAPKSPAPQ